MFFRRSSASSRRSSAKNYDLIRLGGANRDKARIAISSG
jgi:hypothetical protein